MLRLCAVCAQTLAGALTVENAATTLTLAEQHNAGALRDAGLLFVARNAVAVMATPGWAHLKAARAELSDAIIHAMATGAPPPLRQPAAVDGEQQDARAAGGRNVRRRTG